MGTVIGQKVVDTTKTTCIEITSESYKCIDISAFVPQCITITSNVPTSDLYQEQYDREELEITEAPQLQIALINNEAPILNVNMDADGMYYVTDFDTVYIDITNWNANAEYVNVFSNQDGNEAVIFLDEVEERIVWALDDYALDGTQMWLYAQAKESDKLISPQSSVTVMQMEQTDQPNLSSWVSQTEQTVLNITILDYDAAYTYADPIVTGGTAVRTDGVIAWTLPDVTADTYHEISITATAPLMYESLAGVSGGSVIDNVCGSGEETLLSDKAIENDLSFSFSLSTSWYLDFNTLTCNSFDDDNSGYVSSGDLAHKCSVVTSAYATLLTQMSVVTAVYAETRTVATYNTTCDIVTYSRTYYQNVRAGGTVCNSSTGFGQFLGDLWLKKSSAIVPKGTVMPATNEVHNCS